MKDIFPYVLVFLLSVGSFVYGQMPYPGNDPGKANVKALQLLQHEQIVMSNNTIRLEIANDGKNIWVQSFKDQATGGEVIFFNAPLFELTFADNNYVSSKDFQLTASPVIEDIDENPGSVIYGGKLPGKKYSVNFIHNELGLDVHWEAHLRDGSNYIRQFFTFRSEDTAKISKMTLIKLTLGIKEFETGASMGIPGISEMVPIVYNNMFFAIEDSLSKTEINPCDCHSETYDFSHTLTVERTISKQAGYTVSSVWGITPADNLHDGFLYYVDREWAKP